VDALTGQGSAGEADQALWADLPVYPLIQQWSVLAVAPDLTSVLAGAHPGWAWTGPLSGLANWPAS
jgi:hypothetical protein